MVESIICVGAHASASVLHNIMLPNFKCLIRQLVVSPEREKNEESNISNRNSLPDLNDQPCRHHRSVKAYPNQDEDDQISLPNGYAEAIVRGSWTRLTNPYYTVQHIVKSHPSSLSGSARFIGWAKNNSVLYDVSVTFTGIYTYNSGIYNQIWHARTTVVVNGETAEADIGPPGSV